MTKYAAAFVVALVVATSACGSSNGGVGDGPIVGPTPITGVPGSGSVTPHEEPPPPGPPELPTDPPADETPIPPTSRDVRWEDLPPLSPQAKDWIIQFNLNAMSSDLRHSTNVDGSAKWFDVEGERGTIKRWSKSPITLGTESWFNNQDVYDAANLWERATGGKVMFQITSIQTGADVVLKHVDRLPAAGACRQSWITRVALGTILQAEYYSTYGSSVATSLNRTGTST